MKSLLPNSIQELSIAERLQLVQDIWDSIVLSPDVVSITDKQKQELDDRLELYNQAPDTGKSWEEIKKSLITEHELEIIN